MSRYVKGHLNITKVIIVSVIIAAVVITGGILIFKKTHNKDLEVTEVSAVSAEIKKLNNVEEIVPAEVKEEIIIVKKEEEKKEEEVIKYKDEEITIPKRKVAAAKDSEDGQKQKTGGEAATVESFENDGQYVGIDVSSWQGSINWSEVANSGVQFAMIRVGFRGYAEEGNIKEDAYFRQNVNGAVSNGIKVGIYFYSTARNEAEAVQEAAWTVDKIKAYAITYPVAYDFEEFGMHRTAGISGEQATNNAIAFLNYVGSQGFGTMMYASKNDITKNFQKSRLPYKFWLAHYTSSTDYTGSYQMWQRTSKGSVPGINGYVDMNIAYFGYGSVSKPKHTHDFENGNEITNKSVAATCENAGYKMMRCKDCSESKQIPLPAIGHKWSKWTTDTEATCGEVGKRTRTCSNCNKVETEDIPFTGKHKEDVSKTKVIKEATCTEKGEKTATCSVCEKTYPIVINEKGHDYKKIESECINATCQKEGKTVKECSLCKDRIETIEKIKDHSFDDCVTIEATTETEGSKTRTCKDCGKVEQESIPKKNPVDNTIANEV